MKLREYGDPDKVGVWILGHKTKDKIFGKKRNSYVKNMMGEVLTKMIVT